jgi:hypothetical protein
VRSKRLGWYIMAVLNYYRSEWTEISDDDFEYKLVLTNELKELLWACMRRKTNIPNAARERLVAPSAKEEGLDYG